MFRKQIEGVINLSLPIIIVYNFYPPILLTLPGQMLCSAMIGAYLYFIHDKQLENLENSLQFSPFEGHKEFFNSLIEECHVNQNSVIVKYAYIEEGLAMTAGKTVIIDPIVWHGISDDPQAMQVVDIFKSHIEKGLTPNKKAEITQIHQLLTPASQRFIFKHELGHVVHGFSSKKLCIIFFVGFLATYSGMLAANFVVATHGFLAIIVGMFVGGCMDLFVTYALNVVWKSQVEKAADCFAVQYSSEEDIRAAALFFENHQEIMDTYKDQSNFLTNLPSIILSGHLHGKDRSVYLLRLLAKK